MPSGVLAGTQAYWRLEGTGTRRACLIHCTFAHSGAWKGVMARLGDILNMVAMDLPAHGRSGGRDYAMSWQAQSAAMLIELIESGDTPVDLIGHSFGATVAIRIAVTRPDLVRSLTLIEPVFFSAARDAGAPGYAAHLAENAGFAELLAAEDYEGAAKGFADMWGGPVSWEDTPQSQRDYMVERMEMVRDSSDAALGLGADYIPLTQVAKIEVPVLLIEGAQSNPIIASVQASLDGALPNATRVIVKGAGHMVPITHAGVVADHLRRFLSP
jgi:pimeloyl-ACP methyl ester carboxylesterase